MRKRYKKNPSWGNDRGMLSRKNIKRNLLQMRHGRTLPTASPRMLPVASADWFQKSTEAPDSLRASILEMVT